MVVDFMIIGAQKCGTTSLSQQLAGHPEVCFSRIKEPGYFNEADDWRAGLKRYHELFEPLDGQICGEASTMYTFLPEYLDTHVRLYDYNPHLKLIYMMRNPVDRVLSNYTHNLVRSLEARPPEAVVFADPGYISRSRYAVQIRPYLERFGRSQVKLLIFEEYIQNQRLVLTEVADFLEINPTAYPDAEPAEANRSVGEYHLKSPLIESLARSRWFDLVRANVPASIRQPVRRSLSNRLDESPSFSPELKLELWRWLEDDVTAIESVLGRTLSVWRDTFVPANAIEVIE